MGGYPLQACLRRCPATHAAELSFVQFMDVLTWAFLNRVDGIHSAVDGALE